MPFLVGADLPQKPPGERFRALLARPEILLIPGAHTGMASLLAKAAGFDASDITDVLLTAAERARRWETGPPHTGYSYLHRGCGEAAAPEYVHPP